MAAVTEPGGATHARLGDKYGWPWRFACVECGSVSVVEFHGVGFDDSTARFYCEACGASRDEVTDRKQSEAIGELAFRRIVDG